MVGGLEGERLAVSKASIMKEEGEWGCILTLLHSEQPKLYGVLAVWSAIGLTQDGWV